MRSALYYPHTEIKKESLLKTALLLWDEIHVIAPWKDYKPAYPNSLHREAFDVIGKCRVPTDEEKQEAHEMILDFATRPLPPAFSFKAAPGAENEVYEMYPQKLADMTWQMLGVGGLGVVGSALPNSDFPTSPAMGLAIMNILADCCAKKSFTRVTDRGEAYASLQGLLTGDEKTGEIITNELIPISVKVVSAERLSLERLLAFRKKEGAAERDLRHRLQKRIDDQAKIVVECKGQTERNEALRQFEQDNQDDYKLLKEALKLKLRQTLGSKEIILTVIGVAGIAAAAGLSTALPIPEVSTATGGAVTIGGLIAAKSKFSAERQKLLQEHPAAYLYEAAGGLRL